MSQEIPLTFKYPSLTVEFGYLFNTAKRYEIDLSDANHSQHFDHYSPSACECSIELDMTALIYEYELASQGKYLVNYIIDALIDWGYPFDEISEAIANTIQKGGINE